jgi:hypothetical protein
MPSLANEIEVARSRKRVPSFAAGSIRDLARKLDIDAPISIQEVIRQLGDLDPAGVTHKSDDMVAGYVHAYSDFYVQSDGLAAFSGWVREKGVFGDNFMLTVTLLDVKDAQGRAFTLAHADTVAGTATVGFSSKNWTDFGRYPIIAEQWEQAKSPRVAFGLHVRTDPWQVVEGVVMGALVGLGAVFLGKPEECPPGQHHKCRWTTVQKPRPGNPEEMGGEAVLHCECEPD